MDPTAPGLSFHKLERPKDKRFWSVRVSTDIGLIMHRTDSSLLLCYVGHHDRVYTWAERRKLETHPTTGAAQFIEIRESVREIFVPAYVQAEPAAREATRPLAAASDDQLLGYGVPAEWLSDVHEADEDGLLAIAQHLPAEAAEATLPVAKPICHEVVHLPERPMSTNAAREPMSAAPSLSRESRWLRLGGMGLMVVAMFAFVFLKDGTGLRQLIQFGDRPNVTWIALVFLVSGNLFTLGLVLVLAGLRQLSLVTSVHARRGALARMSGASLMLLCLACLTCAGFMPLDVDTTWYVLPIFVAFVPVMRVSIRLFRSGWKHEARTVEEIRASDPRRPVVYLRSFGVDDQLLVPRRGLNARLAGRLAYTVSISPEQEMAFIMEQIGPVVAIGHPGERLPELGAARLYVGDNEWRLVVGELMSDAALVVIRAGETANLWWETREALTRCSPERVIIVALGKPETLPTFLRRFSETFGKPVAPPPVPLLWGSAFLRQLFPLGSSDGKIIYFDRYAKPHEEPLVYRLTLSGAILLSYRPDRDSLQAAFRTVFAKLGLRCVARRTLMTAVLLAFFGGMFGLHHFYTGHRRKGRWYLAFCWLGFPIVLGWIDAVRLALLDDTQFQSRVKGGPVPQDERT